LNFAFKIEGREERPGSDLSANYTSATPSYFRLLKIPLLQGQLLTEQDTAQSPRVCVISSTFAKIHFPGEDPIGRRLVFGFKESVSHEIVGVVADVRRDGLGVVSRPEMYVPFVQEPFWAAYVVVRTQSDPMHLAGVLRSEVHALDPSLPVEGVQPMTQMVSDSVAEPRFRTRLFGLFGGLALVLAVIGIYGVISYSIGRRKREVGLRMALGAAQRDVLRLVLVEGLTLTGAGLLVGALGAVMLTRFVASLLFDIGRWDPLTYAVSALTLLAAGLLASWLPARRAMRVDPIKALRDE
jgi:putative ABC transport system permease protein